jgi:hypothetical protein
MPVLVQRLLAAMQAVERKRLLEESLQRGRKAGAGAARGERASSSDASSSCPNSGGRPAPS